MPLPELEHKAKILNDLLDRHRLDGVLFTLRWNFRWITAGRDNAFGADFPHAPASILAIRSERICVASSLQTVRMESELRGMGWKLVSYPWDNVATAQKIVRETIAGRRIGADIDLLELKLPALPASFGDLPLVMTDGEIARYREGGKRTTAAVQAAARELRPGRTEHEMAGIVCQQLHRQGLTPVRVELAGDERAQRMSAAPPTETKVMRYAVIAASADYRGLICTMSRVVHFGPPPEELRRRYQSLCNLDTAMILSSRPGRQMTELCLIAQRVAGEEGLVNLLSSQHLGGVGGYSICAVAAHPENPYALRENQVMAWTPTFPPLRVGDTMLITGRGSELLTQVQGDWPKLIGHFGGQTLPRADILVQ